MIKLENTVLPSGEQWEAIIRGMRNPMNSWDKSDSYICGATTSDECNSCDQFFKKDGEFSFCKQPLIVGPNDIKLMKSLAKSGSDHAKYRRMIVVYVDITAPLYWWKEFDTYKVGTVANSCSTMHKIHEKEFTSDDFSDELLYPVDNEGNVDKDLVMPVRGSDAACSADLLFHTIWYINYWRSKFLETKDKKYWDQMIQLLPSSYNQRRTVLLNYEVLANIYRSRKNHKLREWHVFCEWVKELPYSELITGEEEES